MRIALFFKTIVSISLIFVADASACTCGKVTVAESRDVATAVFSGRITKKVKSDAVEKNGVEVTFEVDRIWKGKIKKSVVIYAGATADLYDILDLCSPDFAVGDRYVVFAKGSKLLSNMMCSHTTRLESNGGKMVLQKLGIGKHPGRNDVIN